jgi:signal transduction histidine kinase
MMPSDANVTPMVGRGHAAPPKAATRQLLAVGIDRGRLEGIAALPSPHVNLFVTSSSQKALVWTRLESLDLILLRFGTPVEQALDLLQALIEADPAPPVLLLVEPEAEAVAQQLARRQICVAQPASITAELLTQQVLRLFGPPASGRATASHQAEAAHPTAAMPAVLSVHAPPPATQYHPDEDTSRRDALTADAHQPTPPPAVISTAAPAPVTAPAAAPSAASAGAPQEWELPFLDQLVIELAHRLKNPLVSIKTFTHLLQERFNDAEFRTRFYAIVNDDVIQLNDIVDRLLEFTEFSRPYPKPLNPADELHQVVESLEPFLRTRQVTVHVIASDELLAGPAWPFPQIYADPTQFRYLLKQLLLDSASAAAAGGRVQVRLHGRAAGHDETEPACAVQIDTIMASTAPRLHEWLSLELLLAKNLMERHRGTVTVTVSGDANGDQRHRRVTATFPLHSPLRRDAPPHASEPRMTPATVDRRRFPLSIAFRERRVSSRRQGHHAITFSDRRRPLGGGAGAHAFHPYEDRPRSGYSPPFASI